MSTRYELLNQFGIQLFADHETGTWRLFVHNESVDLSLVELRRLASDLSAILSDIERDPESHNAEVVRARFIAAGVL